MLDFLKNVFKEVVISKLIASPTGVFGLWCLRVISYRFMNFSLISVRRTKHFFIP